VIEKTVGIIGGMGPAATVDLQRRIVEVTPAIDDADHIRVLVDNNPKVPSRIAALIDGDGESPVPCMISMAQGLIVAGAELLAIPCNTAHYYFDEVAGAVDAPIINLIEICRGHFLNLDSRPKMIGLLASTAVQRVDLYGPSFAEEGLQTLFPMDDQQAKLMQLIRSVKAGDKNPDLHAAFSAAANNLVDQGAQALLIACTELSVLADKGVGQGPNPSQAQNVPMFDAAQLLAEKIVSSARVTE